METTDTPTSTPDPPPSAVRRVPPWLWWPLALPMVYVLSFFPACWIVMRWHDHPRHGGTVRQIGHWYEPVVVSITLLPDPMRDFIDAGLQLGCPAGVSICPRDPTGVRWNSPNYNYTFLGW